jgi:DNA-binding FrmR family transcriptional regulator
MNGSGSKHFPQSSLPDYEQQDLLLKNAEDHIHADPTSQPQKLAHAHVHSEESLRRIVNRLSRIEGHIRGIKTMVQQNSPCPDVLLQIAAVRGALDRVARIVLDEHLSECILRAAKEGNIDVEIEQLKAALDRFLP